MGEAQSYPSEAFCLMGEAPSLSWGSFLSDGETVRPHKSSSLLGQTQLLPHRS